MKKSVLVIDDDQDILEALTLALGESGYDVVTSSRNGDYLRKLLREHKPDVILLDVLLSGEDGRSICQELKANKETKNVPIIMISAHPSAQEGAVIAGADAFLPKPFSIDALLDSIEKHTAKS
jgi:DNA-binding response OmpR family regulator